MSYFIAFVTVMCGGIVIGPVALGNMIYHWPEVWQNFSHTSHGLPGGFLLFLAIIWTISSYSFVIYNFKIFFKENKNKNKSKDKVNKSPV